MLQDRSAAPARPKVRVTPAIRDAIEALRRTRMTCQAIADHLALPAFQDRPCWASSVSGRLGALGAKPPVLRYQRETLGERIHLDSKKLGRIEGVGHPITGNRQPATDATASAASAGRRCRCHTKQSATAFTKDA